MSTEPPENGRSGPAIRQALEVAGRTAALLGAVWLADQLRSRLESDVQARGASPQDVVLIGISEGLDRPGEIAAIDVVEVAAQVAVLLLRAGFARERVREIVDKILGEGSLPPKKYLDDEDGDSEEAPTEPDADEPTPEAEADSDEAGAEGEGQDAGETHEDTG